MERDDLIVNDSYALNAHHSEEAGVKIRRNIWKVTAILTAITAVEVFLGANVKKDYSFLWDMVVIGFIVMTLIKAGYIVMTFMHLGDERKNIRMTILIPYVVFIVYATVLISIIEGGWQGVMQILP
jgi:cytochrome c oxidase subunit IV